MTVVVRGYRELARTFGRLGPELKKELRVELLRAGEPVRADAERLAASEISNIEAGDVWARMRVGVTSRSVYVAPRARRRRRGPRWKRPNLAVRLLDDAMVPALDANRQQTVANLERMLDRLATGNGF